MNDELKQCGRCRLVKDRLEFHRDKTRPDGRFSYCKGCVKLHNQRMTEKHRDVISVRRKEYVVANRDKLRNARLIKDYGIDQQEFDRLKELQGGVCKLCQQAPVKRRGEPLCVDHCHRTGVVRGLLCHGCNTALGYLDDSSDNLKRALEYLRAFNNRRETADLREG